MRRIIGRYGLTGRNQTCPMKNLSDGQRCRVCFGKYSTFLITKKKFIIIF